METVGRAESKSPWREVTGPPHALRLAFDSEVVGHLRWTRSFETDTSAHRWRWREHGGL